MRLEFNPDERRAEKSDEKKAEEENRGPSCTIDLGGLDKGGGAMARPKTGKREHSSK